MSEISSKVTCPGKCKKEIGEIDLTKPVRTLYGQAVDIIQKHFEEEPGCQK